jgi:KTSC domain
MMSAVGYDQKTRLLEVIFNTGQTYCYEDVPPSEYKGLLAAKSKGRYMQDNILDVYSYYQLKRGQRAGD